MGKQAEVRGPWMELVENSVGDTAQESGESGESGEETESGELEDSDEEDVLEEMYMDAPWLNEEVDDTWLPDDDHSWLNDLTEDYLEDHYDYLQNLDGEYDTIAVFMNDSEEGEQYEEYGMEYN